MALAVGNQLGYRQHVQYTAPHISEDEEAAVQDSAKASTSTSMLELNGLSTIRDPPPEIAPECSTDVQGGGHDMASAGMSSIIFDLDGKYCIQPEVPMIQDPPPEIAPEDGIDVEADAFDYQGEPNASNVWCEQARQNLLHAKKEARLRELRLRVPAICFGAILSISSTTLMGDESVPYTLVLRHWLLCLGSYALLLSLLPKDRRAVPWVIILVVIPINTYFLLGYAAEAHKYLMAGFIKDCTIDDQDWPCWYTMMHVVCYVVRIFVTLLACARQICALKARKPAATVLLVLLSTECHIFIAAGVTEFLIGVGTIASERGGSFFTNLGVASAYMALGLFLGFAPDLRSRLQSWFMSRGKAAATAAAISELLGGQDVGMVLSAARNSFHYIQAERVLCQAVQDNNPNPELFTLTEKGHLGFVDAFLSHSWHDDPHQKWNALQDLRTDFKAKHHKEPKLWIDKFCIDQNNIDKSLACLPVYLTGCSQLWILCGKTYLDRLWCIVEILVFIEMGGQMGNVHVKLLADMYDEMPRSSEKTSGNMDRTRTSISSCLATRLRKFHPRNATCFSDADTNRLLAVLEVTGHEPIIELVHTVFR